MTDTGQDIAQRIASGQLDESMAAIYDAMQARFSDGAVGLTWSIVMPDLGIEISEDDLTIDEAMLIERMTGTTWAAIDPVRSAADCRAVLAACLSQRQNMTADEADAKLRGVKVVDFLRAVKRQAVTPGPLDSAA